MAAACIFFLLLLNGCQKNARLTTDNKLDLSEKTSNSTVSALVVPTCTGLNDVMPAVNYDNDSIERPTVLGIKHVNPYLIPNIQKAYSNLGITSQSVTVTNLYVRFLPNSVAQLGTLDSIIDAQGLDLFDTPMDYDVTEGDYYQDPSIPMEQVTWQYAVVPSNFVAPAGITYQVLAQIHIPGDNYTAVETEAERLAAAQDCANASATASANAVPVQTCPRCQVWSTTQNKCVPYTCPTGYVCDDGGTGGCILQPPPPVDPPAPAADAAVPAGNITVSDVNLGTTPGVRNVRVIVKRWFKIQRLYTDNNGSFTATRRFKHKVKVIVKFENNYADIRGVRGVRLWQMYYAISRTIGVYSGDKNSINFNFQRFTNGNNFVNNKGNRFWVAATVHNAIQEHRDYASQLHFSAPPTGLTIMLTNWGSFSGLASSPLFKKRSIPNGANNDFITVFVGNSAAISPLNLPNLDIIMDYHIDITPTSRPFSSDFINETIYHELSHASHFTQAGMTWYSGFVTSEFTEMGHFMLSPNLRPYGDGNSLNSPIIALGEAWGYFMELYLAHQKYNIDPGSFKGDANVSSQQSGLGDFDGIALENFNPNLAGDPFRWIPKGIMEDLRDVNNENPLPIIDGVSNFTIEQIFLSLQSGVRSIPAFRDRLIQQNPGNQTAQITALFAQYHF